MAQTILAENATQLPSGTTAERPAGAAGIIRHNSTTGYIEYYNPASTSWIGIGQFAASGGTQTSDGTNNIHTFTSPGSFTVFSGAKTVTVEVLGAGGGGGSGQHSWADGGGGGGYSKVTYDLNVGAITVNVGSYGAGGTACPSQGGTGGTSSFASIAGYGGVGGWKDGTSQGNGGSYSTSGAASVIVAAAGGMGGNGPGGNGYGGANGYYQAGLGTAYGSGTAAVPNYTPGNHATGYGNGGGGGPSCQDGHRGGGNGSSGFVIVRYVP